MATPQEAARLAAETALVPLLYWTVTAGALARMAWSGEDGSQMTSDHPGGLGYPSLSAGPPQGSTWAEPPPESTPMSACEPMTAIVALVEGLRGSCPFAFFSKTAPCSSISWAMASLAWTAGVPGTAG